MSGKSRTITSIILILIAALLPQFISCEVVSEHNIGDTAGYKEALTSEQSFASVNSSRNLNDINTAWDAGNVNTRGNVNDHKLRHNSAQAPYHRYKPLKRYQEFKTSINFIKEEQINITGLLSNHQYRLQQLRLKLPQRELENLATPAKIREKHQTPTLILAQQKKKSQTGVKNTSQLSQELQFASQRKEATLDLHTNQQPLQFTSQVPTLDQQVTRQTSPPQKTLHRPVRSTGGQRSLSRSLGK